MRGRPAPGRRVLAIGLDCVPPKLLFERYREAMPNLSRLLSAGSYGALRSCAPPITVPAWACMWSGRDPGELGLYGFRKRTAGGYGATLASARDVEVPRTWDRVARAGKRAAALFVPPGYPPLARERPDLLTLVSCFLTPGADSAHTHPPALGDRLSQRFGPYRMDVLDFRSDQRARILRELYAMGRQHFAIAKHVWRSQRPDFLAMVEIGPDRFHHAFWQAIDPDHPRHDPRDRFAREGERYYRFLDEQIGELLSECDHDTVVLVVSDHGARPLQGGIALNQWLIEQGELVLAEPVATPVPLSEAAIDWTRTRAWADGGYCGRIHLNVAGREPQGVVPASEREALRDELAARLAALPGPGGETLAHRVLVPERAYRAVNGTAPDLMVFLGDLDYRALASVGHDSLYLPGNDRGPDGCNHDWEGVFVMSGGDTPARGRVEGYSLYDVHSTVLGLLGLPPDPGALGVDRSA